MAVQDATTLKGYFNTGDTPTEAQFVDLIDSCIGTGGGGTEITQSTTAPATPAEGDLWLDTDDTASEIYNCSMLVAETTVAGSAVASVTFSDLDGNTDGGYILEISAAVDNASSLVSMTINDATLTGSYNIMQSSLTGGNPVNTLVGNLSTGWAINPLQTSEGHSFIRLIIPPSLPNNMILDDFASSGATLLYGRYSLTNNISNITSITLANSSTYKFAVGSTFRLYRRK